MGVLKQLILLVTVANLADITVSTCLSTQYIEKGVMTSLKCVFPTNFECVVWYKIPGEGPFIKLDRGTKSGPGYESGDYDISSTGRLQINNVSLEDDRFFRVVVLYNKEWEDDVREDIRVHVYVKPLQTFPKIDICGDESYCLTKIDKQIEPACSVIQSRPTVRLQWLNIRGEERELESRTDIQQFDYTASSVAVTTVHIAEGNFLEVLLCRALVTAPVMEQSDAMVLLEGNTKEIPGREIDSQLVEIHDQVLLDIQLDDIYAVVWKKFSYLSFEYETIGHYAHGKSTTLRPDFLIKADGSLQIKNLSLQHEGEYICIYARPLEQDTRKYIVEVFKLRSFFYVYHVFVLSVLPSPPFTTIYGCTERDTCQMDIAETGSLTCTLKGIRPVVHVEWFYPGKGYPPIRFINPKTSIKRKGPLFDIRVTSYFEIVQDRFGGDVNVSCRALGLSEKYHQMSSSITLRLISGMFTHMYNNIQYCNVDRTFLNYAMKERLIVVCTEHT
ncbi:hypothetical protein HOLleu_16090 [Holothuria leucospilota]|uniref:Ig-like domain-containing protein n=1 Tax=Holothuria leucospilota TaxID=206669 RepID=A0A9Q1HA51_HOLLE|nr:hypothetical protein HOLleu_16090 [Holothuria leucospilota]